MTTDPADVIELCRLLRMDATQMQARITDLSNLVAALDLPKPPRYPCTECTGGLEFPTAAALREHLVNVHDWEQLEIGEPASAEERRAHAAELRARFRARAGDEPQVEPDANDPEPQLA